MTPYFVSLFINSHLRTMCYCSVSNANTTGTIAAAAINAINIQDVQIIKTIVL